MIPKPQYPLYSAAITMVGGRAVYYSLAEEAGWTTSWAELERAYAEAVAEGTAVRRPSWAGALEPGAEQTLSPRRPSVTNASASAETSQQGAADPRWREVVHSSRPAVS